VSVSVAPSPIRVPPEGEVPVAVTATNPTAGPVLVMADVDPPPAVVLRRQVSSADAGTASLFPPRTIAAGGSTRWDITVRRASTGALPSSLVLRIASQPLDAAGAAIGPPDQSAVAAELQAEPSEDLAAIASAEVQTALARIDDRRGGDVFVVVRNLASAPIAVSITRHIPSDVVVQPDEDPSGLPIDPGRALTVKYYVKGSRQVEVGHQLLLFEVTVRWGNSGQPRTGTLLASHPVEVGVFGDSELSSLLQVPLLLLPGLFGLAAVALEWRVGVRPSGTAPESFPLDAKSAEFWFFGIVISAIALVVDSLVHGRFGAQSLLVAYGSGDIVLLALLGIACASAVWLTICFVSFFSAKRRIITPGDKPIDVIRKLGTDSRRSLWVDTGTQTAAGGRRVLLVGQNWRRTKWMVCPEIVVRFRTFDPETQELEQRVAIELNRFGSAKHLAELLDPAIVARQIDLKWRAVSGLTTVQAAPTATVSETGDQGPLVVL